MHIIVLPCVSCDTAAHKESEKDKQLEEEEKILQNISETRGMFTCLLYYYIVVLCKLLVSCVKF